MEYIKKYFPDLNKKQIKNFENLQAIYNDWNKKINLISRKDIDNLYLKHVLHSLAIAKYINFKPNTKVLDYGTGGGFPGIPLAIMHPDVKFFLVDSITKKIKVVEDVAKYLNLDNVYPINSRVEDVGGNYDFFVSRSVARLDTAWGWIENKISNKSFNVINNGLIALKGGNLEDQIPKGVILKEKQISTWYDEEFFDDKSVVYIKKVEVPR